MGLERRLDVSQLPAGTVTFLFTDIEGSTRLLQRLGPRYADVLADQRRLLREALQSHGGHEVDNQGDAFFFAFARAADAVAASAAAQRALAAHTWPDAAVVRVRVGLHTGEPLLTGSTYVGLDVHTAARISAAGHGGQVLLSRATHDLVERDLPPETSVRDLGEYRLRDLQRPERLYQLVMPDLPSDFPPLKTLDRYLHNLPVQPTPLLGREREMDAVCALMRDDAVRLVTLTGPGGIGKTRLGLQVAAEVSDHFPDGVCFVALASLTDPSLLAPTIAQTLGLRESGDRSAVESLRAYVAEQRRLLLLDNFEQVVRAAPQVADLLSWSTGLKVLVTSREPLHIRGEHEYLVPPLAAPVGLKRGASGSVPRASEYAAVALFVERARAVKPDFTLTDTNITAIAEICARLDGLPLAIELAAARSKLLSPQAMLPRLTARLQLLTAGPRDLPERQQTLRGAIGWSYDLLTPEERMVFRRLAVFADAFALDAASDVCPAAGALQSDVLDSLSSLVDKSLLRQWEPDEGEPRFSMLETVREFAQEQLAASDEAHATARAHATYYLRFAERAEPYLTRAEQSAWLEQLEREHGNLRAALDWARERGDLAVGLHLASAIWRFWYTHGHLSEGRWWLDALLAQPGSRESHPAAAAKALYGAATLASTQADTARAIALWQESLALFRAQGDHAGTASALNALGLMALQQGDVDRAAALCAESLAVSREMADPYAIARGLLSLGQTAYVRGDYQRAREFFEECLALNQDAGDKSHSAVALLNLGHVAREQGDLAQADARYRESLLLSQELGDKLRIARSLEGIVMVATARDRLDWAARLLGAAFSLRAELGAAVHPVDRPGLVRAEATLRAGMGEQPFDEAWTAGKEWPLDHAIAEALAPSA